MITMRAAAMVAVMAGGLLSGMAGAHAAVIVDSFTGAEGWLPIHVVSNYPGTSALVDFAVSGVAGGARLASISGVTGQVPGFDSVTLNTFNTGGFSFLNYSSDAGASSTLRLAYGTEISGSSIGFVTGSASDSLSFSFLAYDHAGGADMAIYAVVLSGASTYVLPTAVMTTAGAQTVSISLASLPTGATIDGLDLSFRGVGIDPIPVGTDFRLDAVTLVPEPASLGLLGLGAAGLLLRRKR